MGLILTTLDVVLALVLGRARVSMDRILLVKVLALELMPVTPFMLNLPPLVMVVALDQGVHVETLSLVMPSLLDLAVVSTMRPVHTWRAM